MEGWLKHRSEEICRSGNCPECALDAIAKTIRAHNGSAELFVEVALSSAHRIYGSDRTNLALHRMFNGESFSVLDLPEK